MAVCLMCHRKIRDGRKFCDNCKQKRKNKADESYLDSLLNSVGVKQSGRKNKEPEYDDFHEQNQYYDEQEFDSGSGSYGAEQGYSQNETGSDAYMGETDPNAYAGDAGYGSEGADPSAYASDAGFGSGGTDSNAYAGDVSYGSDGIDPNAYVGDVSFYSGETDPNAYTGDQGYDQAEMSPDMPQPDSGSSEGDMDDMISDLLGEMDSAGDAEEQPENDIREEDIESIFDEAEAYAELLNNNTGSSNADGGMAADAGYTNSDSENENVIDAGDEVGNNEESGFIDLEWNNEGSADSSDSEGNGYDEEAGYGSGQDEELDEILLNEGIQGENADTGSAKDAFSDFDPISEDVTVEEKPKKKRLSWFRRLFGNVNDEVTPEMVEADRIKKAEEAEIEKQKKAEKKKKDEEKKAAAKAEKERKKAEADAERNRKLALAIEKKNAAKEKQRKKKEQALAIAEYEVEHGKINKAGATILFVIFAVLTIVIIIGTNIYSYNLSIQNAQKDFDVQKYNEAYYEVYGLKIQDEDIELYDKIMTVMYVNNQLNSYEYYMTSNNRDKALDSLLKGLQRYDKYLQLAQRLGIKNDLDYVKGNILEKLMTEFNLTESDAYRMVTIDDSVDYSEYLYGLLGNYSEELEKYKNPG